MKNELENTALLPKVPVPQIKAGAPFTCTCLGTGARLDLNLPYRMARKNFERKYFLHHIQLANGNISRLAARISLDRTYVYHKLKQLALPAADLREKRRPKKPVVPGLTVHKIK